MAEYLSPLDALSRQMGQTTRSSPLYNDWGIAARNERERKAKEDWLRPPVAPVVNSPQADPKDAIMADAQAGLESANRFSERPDMQSLQRIIEFLKRTGYQGEANGYEI
jgi:hypothetical protein